MSFGFPLRILFLFFIGFMILAGIVLASYYENNRKLEAWRSQPNTQGGLFTLESGPLYSRKVGDGETVVLFINGLGGFSKEWWSLQDKLSKEYTSITFDRPGHGWSPLAHKDKSQDLVSFAKSMGQLLHMHYIHETDYTTGCFIKPRKFIVVGHSLGAILAEALQAKFHNALAGVIYIDPLVVPSLVKQHLPDEWPKTFYDFNDMLSRSVTFAKFGLFRFLNQTPYDVPEDIKTDLMNHLSNPDKAIATHNEYNQYVVNYKSPHEALHQDRCPSLTTKEKPLPVRVVYHSVNENIKLAESFGVGEDIAKANEAIWRAEAERYLQLSSDSQIVESDKGVNALHIENPELILQTINDINSFK